MSLQVRRAGISTRVLYCLALFSVFPGTLARTGWIGLALPGVMFRSAAGVLMLLIAAGMLFRIYQVARYPHALDAYVSNKGVLVLRWLSLIAMGVGAAAAVALFFVRPLTLLIWKDPGENGIAFFVMGVYLVLAASIGWKGCLAFELSRWFGRAPQDAVPRPSFRWKQDSVVAAVLVIICVGGPYVLRATAPEPCGKMRIACVATLKSDVRRMIAAPLDTPVRLESEIHTVRLQMRSGSKVRWEAIESPSRSLEMAGYLPSDDPAVPLRVKIDASESGDAVVLDVSVLDKSEETARFSASFPKGTLLQRDSRGRLNVVAKLPARSDSHFLGKEKDEEGGVHTLDQLFVFMRQAIGTDFEAREHRVRISNEAILTAHTDRVDDPRPVEEIRVGQPIDARCADRLTKARGYGPRSNLAADLGAELMQVSFSGSGAQVYLHGNDRIICPDETTWIVHSVPLDKMIRARRYSPDGTLLRFIESPLAFDISDKRITFVDASSVRESEDGVLFDQFVADGAHGKARILGRDTFRIPLTREGTRVLGAAQ